MTDFTHHTPRLLSDADAAADLAGVARPSDLPSLSSEATRLADELDAVPETGADPDVIQEAAHMLRTLVSERDELASRVSELTDCLEWVRAYIGRYDPPGLPNHVVQKIDEAARNASKEQP